MLFIRVLERSLPERSITPTVVQNATLPLAPIPRWTNLKIPGVTLSLHPGLHSWIATRFHAPHFRLVPIYFTSRWMVVWWFDNNSWWFRPAQPFQ